MTPPMGIPDLSVVGVGGGVGGGVGLGLEENPLLTLFQCYLVCIKEVSDWPMATSSMNDFRCLSGPL